MPLTTGERIGVEAVLVGALIVMESEAGFHPDWPFYFAQSVVVVLVVNLLVGGFK